MIKLVKTDYLTFYYLIIIKKKLKIKLKNCLYD